MPQLSSTHLSTLSTVLIMTTTSLSYVHRHRDNACHLTNDNRRIETR
jgi:hypothetical protein